MDIFSIIKKEALKALAKDEIPVGAAIVLDNKIISKAHNTRESTNNILNHAEILAITKASKRLKTWKLAGATLYTTLEPCSMCEAIIKQSRIKKVIFLTKNNKEINYKTRFEYIKDSSIKKSLINYFKNKRL